MKVSLNWAQWYSNVDLKMKSTDELVKLATERLGGVEGYEEIGKKFDGVVVAKVVSCEKHPNADRLNLCKVDDAGVTKGVERDGEGNVQVVCGAPNVKAGLLVAWIPPKATVPATYDDEQPFVLEARELRGEVSNGMLASPKELGISDDHEGILEIDPNETVTPSRHPERSGNGVEGSRSFDKAQDDGTVKPGTPFKELYGLDDVILEIENKMFTHRPDCFGQIGVARELAGIQHKAFKSPDWYLNDQPIRGKNSQVVKGLSVTIESGDLCPRYIAVVIEGIDIKPSPVWLQSYLKRVGVRPINNVVDITNYMMLETAQPLHAFDFDKVAQNGEAKIVVRRPKSQEKMTLLDGKEIQPHKDAILICNNDDPIALGGVMGGGNSEIDENTKRVVLECATFDMYNIRRTSMIHGIFTDAVTRFTKGQPAAQLPRVLQKTVQMFEELVGAHAVGEVVDVSTPTTNHQRPTNHEYIELTSKFINERLGSKFSDDEIIKLLTNVEFEAHKASGPISVTPPFWRTDIEIPEDIVEEVGRLYGFNQLPLALPRRDITPVQPTTDLQLKQQIREVLSRAGANDVLSYSFVHGDLLKKAGQDPAQAFTLRNALSPDLQYYRLSLLPGLLDKVRMNIKAGYDEFTLFELGKTHQKYPSDEPAALPDEHNVLELVYTSKSPKPGAAYYQLLRQVDLLLSELGIPYRLDVPSAETIEDPKLKIQSEKPYNMSRTAYLRYKYAEQGGTIGFIGELEPSVTRAFKLPEYTAAACIMLDGQSFESENRNTKNHYTPLSKYPSTDQDITLKVSADTSYAKLEGLIKRIVKDTDYQSKVDPVAIFQEEGSDTKNVSFRITLTHHQRTLTTEEVNKLISTIAFTAKDELGATQV